MLTNVPKDNTTAVLMLCATTPKDRTAVHANLDILEMDCRAQVSVFQPTHCCVQQHQRIVQLYMQTWIFWRWTVVHR